MCFMDHMLRLVQVATFDKFCEIMEKDSAMMANIISKIKCDVEGVEKH